eukprot:7995192-Prorocentrum_lima.AAC.1
MAPLPMSREEWALIEGITPTPLAEARQHPMYHRDSQVSMSAHRKHLKAMLSANVRKLVSLQAMKLPHVE